MTLNLDKSKWKRVSLGEVVRHVTDRVDAESSGLERFLAGEHIPSGNLSITDWGVIGRDPIGPMFYKRFKPGHVLYVSRRTYLRKVAVPDFAGITGEKTFVLETVKPDLLLQEFLPFVLSAEVFHAYAIRNSRGSVNPYLNWGELARYEFELPSLDEQKRIADLLWGIEADRRASWHTAAALDDVEDRLSEALHSRAYPMVRVGDLGDVLMGRQKSPKYATGEHITPYLRVANVGDGVLRLDDVKSMNFTPIEQQRYSIVPGDILVSEGQSRELVGQSVLIEDDSLEAPMCFQNTLIRFRPNGRVRPQFAQALFRLLLRTGVFAAVATQTTSIAHLGVNRFAQLSLPLPPISHQDKFLTEVGAVQSARSQTIHEIKSMGSLYAVILSEIFRCH